MAIVLVICVGVVPLTYRIIPEAVETRDDHADFSGSLSACGANHSLRLPLNQKVCGECPGDVGERFAAGVTRVPSCVSRGTVMLRYGTHPLS